MKEYKIHKKEMKIRDVSRRIYGEDIIKLNNLQNFLLRKNIKTTHKDLIDKAIELAEENKNKFLKLFTRKDNTKEMMDMLLSLPKYDFGDNWLDEIDTAGHDYEVENRRTQKKNDKKSNN